MAARFWRFLLGWQLLYAAVVTAALAAASPLSAAELVPAALVVMISAPCLLVASSFVVGRAAARRDGGRDSAPLRGLPTALLRETIAFCAATFATIAEPYRRAPREDAGRAAASPVLLIHGIVCNRAVWRPLLGRLAARGFAPVRAVNLEPLFADIETHTASVLQALRELQRSSDGMPVAIVAHSMGGLVARAALRAGGPGLVSRIVTIASPHHGTALARLFRSAPARQMCPGSAWLRALNASEDGAWAVPVTSIYSLHDNLIAPPRSAALAGARLHELTGFGHLSLLRERAPLERAMAALAGS